MAEMPVAGRSFAAAQLTRFAEALRQASGWRRVGLAFVFGLIAALAFPPVGLFPVLWFCFPALLFLLQGAPDKRSAFITGWCFAFGYFLVGLYWIAAAMFVDIRQFWWAVPLAVAGLPAFLAIYYALVTLIVWRIGARGLSGALLLALGWFLADEARGHLLTGFPWNLEGYVWDLVLPMLQSASVIGIYGLTLVTLISAASMAGLSEASRSARAAVFFNLALLTGVAAWGEYRLTHAPLSLATTDSGANVRLRVVQPNIDQSMKWKQDEQEKNFRHLLELSSAPAVKPLNAIIWPETASTFYLAEDLDHRYELASRIPAAATLLTGVIRRDADESGRLHYYNSLLGFDGAAHITAQYDKAHLVPFGEYIPFRRILKFSTLAALGIDFTPGEGPQTLSVFGLPPFSPLICYEAIFSDEVTDRRNRPQFLLNVTNDGWYGHTAGPYQHYASVRVRAIEEGLPLVRSANTGISAVIDAYGRVRAHIGLGISGVIDTDLPTFLPPTFFTHSGELVIWIFFAIYVLVAVLFRRKR